MYQDFKELLLLFNELKVEYLIVGGYAVSFHAQPRATKDLDILIKADADNAKAVFTALARFGAHLEGLTPEDFIEQGKFYRIGHPPLMIDILPEISGIDFDAAWEKRIDAEIDKGLKVLRCRAAEEPVAPGPAPLSFTAPVRSCTKTVCDGVGLEVALLMCSSKPLRGRISISVKPDGLCRA